MLNTEAPRGAIRFGREICGDLEAGLRREWLVTNGLGGYASGTVAGVSTRRYHGVLVAALEPPVGRTVLVGALDEWLSYGGRGYPLSTQEFDGGAVAPSGYAQMEAFELSDGLPVWIFACGDALVEKRLWMAHGENTTHVSYRLLRGGPVELEVRPLLTWRDFHSLATPAEPAVKVELGAVSVRFDEGRVVWIDGDEAAFEATAGWWWNFAHREEAVRGLDSKSNLFSPGIWRLSLEGGGERTLSFGDKPPAEPQTASLEVELQRRSALIRQAGVAPDDEFRHQLVLAADQFLVRRGPERGAGRTVIAGYHWFNDWGRDTMISLPGLTLGTGRPAEAAEILRTFAGHLRRGLLPNNFPDRAGVEPGYNTVDGALWFVQAVRAYHEATGDHEFVREVLPMLREIVDWHQRGTDFGIGVDPADGLLRAGEAGVQLTWMDAKVGDWVVTPRIGKAVEINALWFNALVTVAELVGEGGERAALRQAAARVGDSFRARFVQAERAGLADVVDGPDGDDWSIRPNQIFAVSLPAQLLPQGDALQVVETVGRELLTSYGLRSLATGDAGYQGRYGGDQRSRDGAYHEGTAWGWLLPVYAEAHFRVHHDAAAARALLAPLADHLLDAGLGSISEIFDGDPPHTPRGTVAQAWSVAEALRVLSVLGS